MNVFCEAGVGQYGERSSVGDAEFAVDAVQVDLDGAFGQP
jgi:hypothetical protein